MHDHKQTYGPPLPVLRELKGLTPSSRVYLPPWNYDAQCHQCQRIETSSVRLRVPMVLFFIGNSGDESDVLMRGLDVSLALFEARQVQLLVVVREIPSKVALRLKISVPVIRDNGLGSLLRALPNCQNPNAAVILGNNGRSLGVVRKFPFMHPALSIVGRIDDLSVQFPDLFNTESALSSR